jgi:sulfite reductase alpha subunit-like flavoprotein
VPVAGDLMTSRWAYEALMVEQFKSNDFQKHFFILEEDESQLAFLNNFRIPEIMRLCEALRANQTDSNSSVDVKQTKRLIINEIQYLLNNKYIIGFIQDEKKQKNAQSPDLNFLKNLNPDNLVRLNNWLSQLKIFIEKQWKQSIYRKDTKYESLVQKYGKNYVTQLKTENYNEKVAEIVLSQHNLTRISQYNDRLIQLFEPVYMDPESKLGRAQLFASKKQIGNVYIDTFVFNTSVIWFMVVLFYITLYFNVLKKSLEVFSRIKYPTIFKKN